MIDQVIVGLYLIISLIIGIIYGRNTNTIEDYAIGRRNFSTSALVAAISATMISAAGTAGLSGKVYSFGIIYALSFCFGSVISRMVVAFFIAPKMDRFLGMISSGDVLEKLYGTKAKILMGILVIAEGPLLAAAQVLATYQISRYFFGISQETAAIVTSAVIVIYCFRGGIRAVSYTDVFQFIMIIVAIPIVSAIAIEKLGGFSSLLNKADDAGLLFSRLTNQDILKHVVIFSSLSLTSIFPLTIQRMLMAKNTKQIRYSFFFNGVVTLPFYLIIGIVGLSAPLLLPGIEPNFALPALTDTILPIGIKGVVIAGVIAIFMSSADSQMNITTVAITQDLLKPIFKDRLTPKLMIVCARITFILTGLFATAIALYASNALDLLFVVMVLCNSVYFPGYFLGILGFTPSRRAFWIGASFGAAIAFAMCVVMELFPLYAMLSAIAANMCSLLISHHARKLTNHAPKMAKLRALFSLNRPHPQDTFFDLKVKSDSIAHTSFCDTFSFIVLISSLLPFFLHWTHLKSLPYLLTASYIVAATFAVLLLMRQTSKTIENNFFSPLWHTTLFLSLTFQSIVIFSHSESTTFWVADSIVVATLLFLLLRQSHAVMHLLAYAAFALAAMIYVSQNTGSISLQIAYFPFLSHIVALVVCLFMFRRRDIAAYHFMTTKLAHEAGRSITSFSSSAAVLQHQLPILIESYSRINTQPALSDLDLESLRDMPSKLIETSNRSWQNLKQMLLWMETDKANAPTAICSLADILKSVLEDTSLSNDLKRKISIEEIENFLFRGDASQIGQVMINIFENAHHATKNNAKAKITIFAEGSSLFIEDNGSGVSNKDLPNIFDEFFSTKGTAGQGLAFCKLIMENHGGNITCESKPGLFTRFKLTFPQLINKSDNIYEPTTASNL